MVPNWGWGLSFPSARQEGIGDTRRMGEWVPICGMVAKGYECNYHGLASLEEASNDARIYFSSNESLYGGSVPSLLLLFVEQMYLFGVGGATWWAHHLTRRCSYGQMFDAGWAPRLVLYCRHRMKERIWE